MNGPFPGVIAAHTQRVIFDFAAVQADTGAILATQQLPCFLSVATAAWAISPPGGSTKTFLWIGTAKAQVIACYCVTVKPDCCTVGSPACLCFLTVAAVTRAISPPGSSAGAFCWIGTAKAHVIACDCVAVEPDCCTVGSPACLCLLAVAAVSRAISPPGVSTRAFLGIRATKT